MRKGRDGEKKKRGGKKRKRRIKIVATMSLPAVDRPNDDRWNAARSRQKPRNPQKCPQTLSACLCSFLVYAISLSKLSIEPLNYI